MNSPQAALWNEAEEQELKSQLAHGMWELVLQPCGKVPIGGKLIFSLKHDADGRITKFKARWWPRCTASRKEGTMGRLLCLQVSTPRRVNAAVVAEQDLDEVQADVPTMFPNGEVEEELYVQQPKGYKTQSQGHRLVCRLLKALYVWSETVTPAMAAAAAKGTGLEGLCGL